MKVLFMGRKPSAAAALRKLLSAGVQVPAVIAPLPEQVPDEAVFWRPRLSDTARELGIPVVTDEIVYRWFSDTHFRSGSGLDLYDLDAVISFLYWRRVEEPLLSCARIGAFNFHPGPLPEFRGRRGYNFAILEGHKEYGATVHWMTQRFDEGDIVAVRKFPITDEETAHSLEQKTQGLLLEMFTDFVRLLLSAEPIPRTKQGPGKSATKAEMMAASRINLSDDPALTARRIRAFWYPPHTGATLEINGVPYTVVDGTTLQKLGEFIHGKRNVPY